jgi:hypothetical protein
MSGTAVSDAAGLGQIEIAAMTKNGYEPTSCRRHCRSSTIGRFSRQVSPCHFSTVSGVSVGKLFLGGVVRDSVDLVLMVMVYFYAKKGGIHEKSFRLRLFWNSFKGAILPLLTSHPSCGYLSGTLPQRRLQPSQPVMPSSSRFHFKEMTWKFLSRSSGYSTRYRLDRVGHFGCSILWMGVGPLGLTAVFADWILALPPIPSCHAFINVFFLVIGCFLNHCSHYHFRYRYCWHPPPAWN